VDTCDELFDRIMDAIARIKERQDELRGATCHVLTRIATCIDVDGRFFENLL
jgi:predicted metal-dependent peptidase